MVSCFFQFGFELSSSRLEPLCNLFYVCKSSFHGVIYDLLPIKVALYCYIMNWAEKDSIYLTARNQPLASFLASISTCLS